MGLCHGEILDDLTVAAPDAPRIAVIGLTRRAHLRTTLAAFEQGEDDLLTVPFSPAELLTGTLATVRRSYQMLLTVSPTIRLGELEIDILNRRVRAGESELHLDIYRRY